MGTAPDFTRHFVSYDAPQDLRHLSALGGIAAATVLGTITPNPSQARRVASIVYFRIKNCLLTVN